MIPRLLHRHLFNASGRRQGRVLGNDDRSRPLRSLSRKSRHKARHETNGEQTARNERTRPVLLLPEHRESNEVVDGEGSGHQCCDLKLPFQGLTTQLMEPATPASWARIEHRHGHHSVDKEQRR